MSVCGVVLTSSCLLRQRRLNCRSCCHCCCPPLPPLPRTTPVLGFTDKDNTYLPPYYWFADSAAAHLIDVTNKYYAGTGFSFYIPKVGRGQQG